MNRLLEELELDQCDYLNQPGCKKQVEELVREYQDIFTDEGKKVGMVPSRYCTTIKLKPGAVPVKQKLRPMHPQQQAELKEQLDAWLKEGVIRPSKSPWASLLIPVKKKDGRTRWCVDYRQVNARTVGDSFPSPTVEEILAEVRDGDRVFSTLDASQAYLSVPLDEESMEITAFVTPFGLFEFTRTSFGLLNAGVRYN